MQARTRNIAADWSRMASKTTAAKRRGWNMRAGYWYAQLAAEASPRPCWRTN
jgi:hypothetical protein